MIHEKGACTPSETGGMKSADAPRGMVLFDLDGTLLDNAADLIPESAMRAVSALKAHYRVVIASGRDMDTHYSLKYQALIQPDAIIHLNGNKITAGKTLIAEHFMEEALLREIAAFAEIEGICIGTTIGDTDFYTHPEKKRAADLAYNKFIRRNFAPMEELFRRGLRVHALSYAGDLRSEQALIERRFPSLELLGFNSERGADVVERGFSKAEGMRRLCAYFGISKDATYAFGDSLNDVEMIRAAGCGIAVGGAVPELKAAADYVTDEITADGIWNACRKLGLIG